MAKRPTSSSAGKAKAGQIAGPASEEAQAAATPPGQSRSAGKAQRKSSTASRSEAADSPTTVPPKADAAATEPPASGSGGRSRGKAATARQPEAAVAEKAKQPRTKKSPGKTSDQPTAPNRSRSDETQPPPRYLATELGQPTDPDGEPIGAGSTMARSDSELQEYTLQLWRQMQSGRVVHRYTQAIERAGLTIDEVWAAGITETRTTSSTPDEMLRYRQKMLFRANLLEAMLAETVADLHRLDGIEPTPGTAKKPL